MQNQPYLSKGHEHKHTLPFGKRGVNSSDAGRVEYTRREELEMKIKATEAIIALGPDTGAQTMTRQELIWQTAKSSLSGWSIKVDYKRLCTVATLCGFAEMDSPQSARKYFIADLVSALRYAGSRRDEFFPALLTIQYDAPGKKSADGKVNAIGSFESNCVIIGRRAYVYDCEFYTSCPDPERYVRKEIGKSKILSKFVSDEYLEEGYQIWLEENQLDEETGENID
jgi:hypothetical protein